MAPPKCISTHSFNALIFPILRGCPQSFSMIWVLIASVPGLCIRFTFSIRVLVVVPCGGPKMLPAHPFNDLIFQILRGCLQSFSIIWVLITSVSGLCIPFPLSIRVLVDVPCGGPKSLPAHPFNAFILPILRGCLQSFSMICILFTFSRKIEIASVPGLCILFTFIIKSLVVVPCGGPKTHSAHPFNAIIHPILRGCLQSFP